MPGIFSTWEKLKKYQRHRYITALKKVDSKKVILISQLKERGNLSLHPDYLQSLFMFSPTKNFSFVNFDSCSFYASIENNLLYPTPSELKYLMIIFNPNKDQKSNISKKTLLLSKKRFLFDYYYQKECPKYLTYAKYFSEKKIENSLISLKVKNILKKKSCSNIVSRLSASNYFPYLCGTRKKLKHANLFNEKSSKGKNLHQNEKEMLLQGNRLSAALRPSSKKILKRLCDVKTENICAMFQYENFFTQFTTNPIPYFFKSRCLEFFKKETLSAEEYTQCAHNLSSKPGLCHYLTASKYPTLLPMPSCKHLEDTFKIKSKLVGHYDCPGKINNQGMINAVRIMRHFRGSTSEYSGDHCFTSYSAEFAKMIANENHQSAWDFNICYFNKIEGEEVCHKTILGSFPQSQYSEEKVIEKILKTRYPNVKNLKCQILDKEKYRPELLGHKSGCYIVYQKRKCWSNHCNNKIILNGKEVDFLNYRGNSRFDYFPSKVSNAIFSIENILTKTLKLRPKKITNLTELKLIFSKDHSSIIHGIGCLEDIHPGYFKKHSLNQCTPLPFIIDGTIDDNNMTYLIVKGALDSMNSPRILHWNYMFSALKNYELIMPLSLWPLYALRK